MAESVFEAVKQSITVREAAQMTANRLKIDIKDLGAMAVKGNWANAKMNSYCSVFGIQDLVTNLGDGKKFEDVAAAACHSVAEQVYEQQLQEIDVAKGYGVEAKLK